MRMALEACRLFALKGFRLQDESGSPKMICSMHLRDPKSNPALAASRLHHALLSSDNSLQKREVQVYPASSVFQSPMASNIFQHLP